MRIALHASGSLGGRAWVVIALAGCLDVVEDVDMDDRMRERRWGSARGVWELRQDACHEPSNEATALRGIEWRCSR